MKVSLSPDVILCGWQGLKHQLANRLALVYIVEKSYLPYIIEQINLSSST